jgi:hypothetical protein
MNGVNVKLPNELIGIILKLKYFNFRKEWLEKNLEFPKRSYLGRDYTTTYYTWCVNNNLSYGFTSIDMHYTSDNHRSTCMIYMWQIDHGKDYVFYD